MIQVDLIDEIISVRAALSPDAEAFRFGAEGLTYRMFEGRVNTLANCLASRGVQPGDRVGVFVNKSLDSAISIYAIMRAGAAYVPLDPGAPATRLSGMIATCDIRVLVSQPAKMAVLGELVAKGVTFDAVVDIHGTDLMLPKRVRKGAPPGRTDRSVNDVAYIIFTSGSTGTPKGIVHTHASALAFSRMSADLYGLMPEDRLSNHSPLHFDMSTFDMFSGPLAGACTVIISEMHAKLPASLSQLIEFERLTVWYSVPYALIQLVEKGVLDKRDFSALRLVIFGGEPMLPRQLLRFAAYTPNAVFSNSYGPAEVNQCTFKNLLAADIDPVAPIPIGASCSHSVLYIEGDGQELDEGELLVSTPAMMREYWGDAERNARCFRWLDPGDGKSRRYYATGDIVRRDRSGDLHFVGRADRQVKVRGFRIELDEIELVLSAHEHVSEAAAVVGGDPTEIIGFVTPCPGPSPSENDIRAHCVQRLAHYAVPSRLVILPAFERTATGKIDRTRLAEMTYD